jgi:hypothetical protein
MKDELLPGLVLTRSGLLIDLDRRVQLDETLVVLLSEHGRTPKLASVQGGSRQTRRFLSRSNSPVAVAMRQRR